MSKVVRNSTNDINRAPFLDKEGTGVVEQRKCGFPLRSVVASPPASRRRAPLSLILPLLLFLGACDTSIQPFDPGDRAFSLFGYLDVAADTQFVRVAAIRDSIAAEPGPIDATVTLHERGTNRVVTLQDSLFTFFDLNESRIVYNFFTPERLQPNATYELRVERSDGATATAVVPLPELPQVTLEVQLGFGFIPFFVQTIRIPDSDKVIDITITYRLRTARGGDAFTFSLSYLDLLNEQSRIPSVTINAYNDLLARFPGTCPQVLTSEVLVAVAPNDFPDLTDVDLETVARPDVITNVEGGVGFVGGVAIERRDWPELTAFLGLREDLCQDIGR